MTLVERSVEVYIPLFRELRHAVVGRYYEVDAVEDGRAAYLAEEVCQCRVDMLYRRYYLVRVGAVSCMTASGSSKYHITRLGMRPSAASPHMLATTQSARSKYDGSSV